jgi:pimeloyl-ACP methyl ester carboxylesterase
VKKLGLFLPGRVVWVSTMPVTRLRIFVPTLVVAANQDPVTKLEASERLASDIPTAGHPVALAPAKHLGLIEHRERYAEVVREFAYAARAQMREKSPTISTNRRHLQRQPNS